MSFARPSITPLRASSYVPWWGGPFAGRTVLSALSLNFIQIAFRVTPRVVIEKIRVLLVLKVVLSPTGAFDQLMLIEIVRAVIPRNRVVPLRTCTGWRGVKVRPPERI